MFLSWFMQEIVGSSSSPFSTGRICLREGRDSKKVRTDPTFSRQIFSLSNHITEICFSREQIHLA
jgi:hypothetical protein